MGLAAGALVLLAYTLAPVCWLVSSSLQTEREIVSVPPHWIPERPTLFNFEAILAAGLGRPLPTTNADPASGGFIPSTAGNLMPAMTNSLIVAVAIVVLNLVIGVPAAYAMAKIRFRGRQLALYSILATRVVPDIALVVPFFLVIRKLGLLDNLVSLIVTYLAITLPFSVFILTSFFEQLPDDLDRAARVDGCSRWQAMLRVFLPLAAGAGGGGIVRVPGELERVPFGVDVHADRGLADAADHRGELHVGFHGELLVPQCGGSVGGGAAGRVGDRVRTAHRFGADGGRGEGVGMARIEFAGVGKRYRNGVPAVQGLDLAIAHQEFLVLLGPSGCGKSTTLNMIAGLEEITEGVLRFDDQVMNNVPAHKRDVAMVFQSYALYPHKTVFENIAFGLRMRRVAEAEIRRRVLEAAQRLEIEALLDRLPGQLSGGQRQRVALGRAMVRQPAVFLMDEPLSNLDASLRIAMRAQIRHLHAQMRTTFVYVTHDPAEALTLADRIVVMRDGRIQQIGTPDDIYERPQSIFVASFLGHPVINLIEGELRGAPGSVVLGLRAEDVGADGSGGVGMRGRVDTVLPAGSDLFLGLKVEGADVFVRVGKETRVREGETITLPLVAGRLHLFDKETGRSLWAEAGP